MIVYRDPKSRRKSNSVETRHIKFQLSDSGWTGKKNGIVLSAAEDNSFWSS